jgi:hypothetical protein
MPTRKKQEIDKIAFMPRDDFAPHIKRSLAQRAGYLCSICDSTTVGPSDESDTSVNVTGIAAHITAASPGGRRYDPRLTPESRASIDNGIWLCNTHADLIDGDEVTFTADYLKFTKKNHEEKIKFKQLGINVEKGIITKIELANLGLISSPISLEFTERNIIHGVNGVGKTLICEFIAALTDKKHLDRWTGGKKNTNSFCNIFYFRNQPDKFTIAIDRNNEISYFFNDNPIPLLIPPMNVFYLKESFSEFLRRKGKWKSIPVVNLLSEYFNLSETEFINVVSSMIKDRKYFVDDISFNDTKDNLIVKCYSSPNSLVLPFGSLSDGERQRAILDITLKIADYYAKFSPTILLIENTSFGNIDNAGINCLFEIIRKDRPSFQFIFTTVTAVTKFNTKEFKVHELIEIDKGKVVAR